MAMEQEETEKEQEEEDEGRLPQETRKVLEEMGVNGQMSN